jgi:hypothetical protein
MTILGIDPGTTESQLLVLAGSRILERNFASNHAILADIPRLLAVHRPAVCIEGVQGMGMIVGQEVFDTAVWVGRYFQQCENHGTIPAIVFRRTVKLHICGNPRAKDGNIRQALIDRFGGKERAIGKKATPGPLYGVSSHAWSALALAITFAETRAIKAA